MLIGVLNVEFRLPGASSLKEKRLVVKSLKTRIRNKFNVSVAEVDFLDKWQRCELGIVMVANSGKRIEERLNAIIQLINGDPRIEVLKEDMEFI